MKKKPETPQIEMLCEHLRRIGIAATEMKKAPFPKEYLDEGHATVCHEGYAKVENTNIDFVEFNSKSSPPRNPFCDGDFYVDNPPDYWIDFVILIDVAGLEDELWTVGRKVRKSYFSIQVIDFRWRGNKLAQRLNNDAKLKSQLISQFGVASYIWVEPRKIDQCVRIVPRIISYDFRTSISVLPNIEAFRAYDMIAYHIRSMVSARSSNVMP